MTRRQPSAGRVLRIVAAMTTVVLIAYAGSVASQELKVPLSGDQEIPPVKTSASGNGTITVGADKSVTGKVTISGLSPTFAHVHEGAAGTNGPIIFPLTKVSDTVWEVPKGTKMTDAQYDSYKAGKLYFNFHTDAHKGGEIRGQIKP